MNSTFNPDLSKLSDEVLKVMGSAIRDELQKRRSVKKISKFEYSDNITKTVKLFNKSIKSEYNFHWLKYLDLLIKQDWSDLFTGEDEKKYYVYFHITPNTNRISHDGEAIKLQTNGVPFYVGKGSGLRAFDLNRNQGHGVVLKQLIASGYCAEDIVYIVKEGMAEAEALELESKLIYFFGTKYEKGRKGILLNLDMPKRKELTLL